MKHLIYAARIVMLLCAGLASARGQSIVSINPTFGQANSYVTIAGYNLTSSTVVRFGTTKAVATLTGTIGGVQQMQATVPDGLTAPVLINVQNGAGQQYNSPSYFTNITTAPFITDFSPSSGNAGTPVTINGANFSGATGVKFGTLSASFTATIQNRITATAPNGVVTGPITVTTPKGSYVSGANFFAAPTITGFTPSNGTVGTRVLITGTNLLGATQVSFGSIPATSFVVSNNNQISAIVPDGFANGVISVNAAGTITFSAQQFAVLPTVFGFSPGTGQLNTPVTITGLALSPGSPQVSFGGSTPVAVSSATYNQIIVLTPSTAVSGPLTIITANGSFTTTNNYLVPPQISSIIPNHGRPGTLVTIAGTNLTNATAVSFSGVSVGFTNISNASIIATVPNGASSGTVAVTTPAGSASSSSFFLIPPLITGFSPLSGVSGTSVTISGSFPDPVTNVFFNLAKATIASASSSAVQVTVPSGATTGPITVYALGGTNVSATAFTLDVWMTVSKLGDHGLQVSWPTNAAGFALQYRTNTAPAPWVTYTNPTLKVVGDHNVFTNGATNLERYFRLKK